MECADSSGSCLDSPAQDHGLGAQESLMHIAEDEVSGLFTLVKVPAVRRLVRATALQ